MISESLIHAILANAEAEDRRDDTRTLARLKEVYDFYHSCGLDGAALRETMGISSHQLRLIRQMQN